jgi:hypothetical protein
MRRRNAQSRPCSPTSARASVAFRLYYESYCAKLGRKRVSPKVGRQRGSRKDLSALEATHHYGLDHPTLKRDEDDEDREDADHGGGR